MREEYIAKTISDNVINQLLADKTIHALQEDNELHIPITTTTIQVDNNGIITTNGLVVLNSNGDIHENSNVSLPILKIDAYKTYQKGLFITIANNSAVVPEGVIAVTYYTNNGADEHTDLALKVTSVNKDDYYYVVITKNGIIGDIKSSLHLVNNTITWQPSDNEKDRVPIISVPKQMLGRTKSVPMSVPMNKFTAGWKSPTYCIGKLDPHGMVTFTKEKRTDSTVITFLSTSEDSLKGVLAERGSIWVEANSDGFVFHNKTTNSSNEEDTPNPSLLSSINNTSSVFWSMSRDDTDNIYVKSTDTKSTKIGTAVNNQDMYVHVFVYNAAHAMSLTYTTDTKGNRTDATEDQEQTYVIPHANNGDSSTTGIGTENMQDILNTINTMQEAIQNIKTTVDSIKQDVSKITRNLNMTSTRKHCFKPILNRNNRSIIKLFESG